MKLLELTKVSAQTVFETSVSCIGANTCQQGIRDSQGLLDACIQAVRAAKIPNGALPQIHIPAKRFPGCTFPAALLPAEPIKPGP